MLFRSLLRVSVPDTKQYTTLAPIMNATAAAYDGQGVAAVGREAVNGVATTKYRVAHRADDGTRIDGFVWLTSSGVPMRGDGAVSVPNGKRTPFAWELSQLQIGPQPASLFQPPDGFYRLPASALPGFLGGQGG